jgi:hypothetical protein
MQLQRSVLDLQQVIRGSLDVLRNLVPGSGPKQQRTQDQHVLRPLQQLDPVGGSFGIALVDILPGMSQINPVRAFSAMTMVIPVSMPITSASYHFLSGLKAFTNS